MFFGKKIKPIAAKKRKVTLALDLNKIKGEFLKQQNVQKVGNTLQSTFSFADLNYDVDISRAVLNLEDQLMVLVVGRGLYICLSNRDNSRILPGQLTDCVIGHVRYNGQVVFSCTEGTYVTANGMSVTKLNSTYFPSLAVCNDRVFGVNGNQLSMTVAGDISNWDDSLIVTAHTQLDALVTLDKLYALGDTCYTLTPDGEEMYMKFAPFCYNVGAVQAESVVVFDKRAIFASHCGLFQLKNGVITPIFAQLNDYVSFDGCVACQYDGKYFVTCKRKDGDLMQNDILLALDVDTQQICAVLDVKMQHISVVNGKFYAVCNNRLCVTDDNVVGSYCETVDFGCSDVKYLDRLAIRTKYDIDVWIDNGSEKRRYCIAGKNHLQKIPLVGFGRQFTINVKTKNEMRLDYLELSARSYEV